MKRGIAQRETSKMPRSGNWSVCCMPSLL